MKVTDAIARRRSIRHYEGREMSKQQIQSLLEAAFMAPSAGDVHPYEVVVVLQQTKRKELAMACYNEQFVLEAPVDLVFLVNEVAALDSYGNRGIGLYSLLDIGAAVENLMLKATEMGLGTCWIGAFDERKVRAVISPPDAYRPVTIVTLGYPLDSGRFRPPPSLQRRVYLDGYGKAW